MLISNTATTTNNNEKSQLHSLVWGSLECTLILIVLYRQVVTTKFVILSSERIAGRTFQHLQVILKTYLRAAQATLSLCARGSE